MTATRPSLRARLLLSLGSLVATLLALEGGLRLALAVGWPASLRDAGLYADGNSDDDFWKLRWIWEGSPSMGPMHHPLLGWTTPDTPDNPLGQLGRPRPLPAPGDAAPVAVFYGDSYLDFPADADSKLPALLESRLNGTRVYNLGMGSYGIDQMALRWELTHARFPGARVLFGILTGDVDRCVLGFRQGQKPRYVVDGAGALTLTNVPIVDDQASWLREHPVGIASYLGRFLQIELADSPIPFPHRGLRQPEKRKVVQAILAKLVADARAAGTPPEFAIFYDEGELVAPNWRATLLRETLAKLGARCLDAREPLLRAVRETSIPVSALFDPANRHHSRRANEIIADALAAAW